MKRFHGDMSTLSDIGLGHVVDNNSSHTSISSVICCQLYAVHMMSELSSSGTDSDFGHMQDVEFAIANPANCVDLS